MLTQYHIEILKDVATYYTRTRQQIQRRCCPKDMDGRVTRKRLQQLVQKKLLNRTNMEVVRAGSSTMSAYYPSRGGLEFLAAHTGDESWMHRCSTCPNWQHLAHWVEVAEFHERLDQAAQGDANIGGWFGEWDVLNPDESEPHKRFRLFTLLREKPRLVSNPDAAFVLRVKGHAKIHYVEIDRQTSAINQIANSKSPGYVALAEKKLHRRHFETTSDTFWVLSISPNAKNVFYRRNRSEARMPMTTSEGSRR